VEALDVKYILSGCIDKNIDPAIVSAFETLQRGGRKRRGREFFMEVVPQSEKQNKGAAKKNVAEKPTKVKAKTAIHNQQPGMENNAAARPPEPSPVPTTESSPTTPERKPKPKAKRVVVTPIPSIVIADSKKIQVSPLPTHDRPIMKKAAKPAVARRGRGLFEGPDVASAQRDQRKAASHIVPSKEAPPVQTTLRVSKVAVGKVASKKVAKKDSASDEESFSELDNLKISRRKPSSYDDRKVPPKPILEFPRQKKSNNVANMTSRKPLKEVFDDELKKANNFVNEVVGSRKHDGKAPAAKENSATSQKLVKKSIP
jgi:hypothetical protein